MDLLEALLKLQVLGRCMDEGWPQRLRQSLASRHDESAALSLPLPEVPGEQMRAARGGGCLANYC